MRASCRYNAAGDGVVDVRGDGVGIGVIAGIGEIVGSGAGVGIGVIAGIGVTMGLGVACANGTVCERAIPNVAPSASNAKRIGFIEVLYPKEGRRSLRAAAFFEDEP